MDEFDSILVFILCFGIGVFIFGITTTYISEQDSLVKDTTCKTLNLGAYTNNGLINSNVYKENNKQINGINYFKCTNFIYNSTSKEITVSEKD